jgi:hypothetical protein
MGHSTVYEYLHTAIQEQREREGKHARMANAARKAAREQKSPAQGERQGLITRVAGALGLF